MTQRHRGNPIWGSGALALILALSLSGCGFYKKYQANKKNEEVQAGIAEIQAQEAARYLPREFGAASQSLAAAQGAVTTGDYDAALSSGDAALGQIEGIRGRLPQARSVIEQKRAALVGIHNGITHTVEQIKTIAPDETGILEGAAAIDGLIGQVQGAQAQVSEGELGYDAALAQAKAFLDGATASLAQFETERADQLVLDVEDIWTQALELDVVKYVEDAGEVPGLLEHAKELIASGSPRATIDAYSDLPDRIGRFRERARERRAEARIEQADRLIVLAEDDPDASLDAIEAAKAAVRTAMESVQEGNYDSAYGSAENAIATAREQVKTIEEDLKSQVVELEKRIEQSLSWETQVIAASLYRDSLDSLTAAQDSLEDILFDDAQDHVDRGSEIIEEAIAEARTEGLTQRRDEDEASLQETQEVGAFQYLRDEYQSIQERLGEIDRLVALGHFDEAEEILSEIEERTLGLETGLRDLAQNRLASAESEYQEAIEAQAEEHASDVLQESSDLLDKARSASANGNWKEAIGSAEDSQAAAQKAAAQSYRIRTDDLRPQAEEEIERAREAGASAYAADVYNKALAALDNSQVAYQEEHFRTALDQLTQARDQAADARRYQIVQAQNAVDSAIQARAGDHEGDLLGEALADLAEARSKMEEGDYSVSLELAEKTAAQARTAETDTWNARAAAAVAELEKAAAQAENDRAPKYAETEYKTVARTLDAAKADYAAKNYRESYEAADRGRGESEEIVSRLTDEARLARGDYDRLVSDLKTYVKDDFGGNLHLSATVRLGAIDEAILRNNFHEIFNLYEEGTREVENSIVAVKLHNINATRDRLGSRIAQADQAGLFDFVQRTPAEMTADVGQMTYDPALDRLKEDVDYYAEETRELAGIEDELDRLEGNAVANISTRVERVRTDIDNAGKIGARDLVPGVFNSAVDNYEQTRDMLYVLENDVETDRNVTFLSLGQQLSAAEGLAEQLNQTSIEKNNSVNYLRDLIFWTYDMTNLLAQWYPVEEVGYEMILTSNPSSEADTYKVMQAGISARDLLREAERLYERVKPLAPPAAQAEFHGEALRAFRLFLKTADGFYRFGQYARYPERVRVRFLAGAFQDLEKLHLINDQMISIMLKQVSRYDMIEFEREFADEFNAFKSYLRRDKSTR